MQQPERLLGVAARFGVGAAEAGGLNHSVESLGNARVIAILPGPFDDLFAKVVGTGRNLE